MRAGSVVVVVDGSMSPSRLVVVVDDEVVDPFSSIVVEVDDVDVVEEVDDVVVDDVAGGDDVGDRRRSRSASSNSPVSMPSSASLMNRPQICAGNDPPVTARPWTEVILRSVPSL